MSRPLTTAQIRTLAVEARKAWNALPEAERDGIIADYSTGERVSATRAYEFWRRREQREACGLDSMSDMSNSDFDKCLAHWKHIQGGGSGPLAKEAWVIESQADARRLRWLIAKEANATGGLGMAYAQTLCKDKSNGLALHESGDKTLTQVLATLRNRTRRSNRATTSRKPHDWAADRAFRDGRSRVATAKACVPSPVSSLRPESLRPESTTTDPF